MTWLDPQLSAFTVQAEQALGGKVFVAMLDDHYWLARLAPWLQPAGAAGWIPKLDPEGTTTEIGDWYGLLDLDADSEARVLVRRLPALGQFGGLTSTTFAAARTREHVDRLIQRGLQLWSHWRRTEARVGDATGRGMKLTAVAWTDICLPAALLDEIRANVAQFAAARELYAQLALPYRRGILLYGPPGNGKTMTCRAIVTELGWPVIYVSPHSHANAADEIVAAFDQAKDLSPCVVWFDDVDSLFDNDATLSSFLNRLDGATAAEGTLVLATTNRPERLDPAIVARPSRFDRLFEVGLPAAAERDRFLARRFGDRLNELDRTDLVQRTAGMSMAFVQEVFVGAALRAVARGDQPTAEDARAVHAALSKHVKITANGFEPASGTGFGRGRDNP